MRGHWSALVTSNIGGCATVGLKPGLINTIPVSKKV